MPGIDYMGIENSRHGICGFTSTLYAIYTNRPGLRSRLKGALKPEERAMRLMAEIKTFLSMLKAESKRSTLNQIEELTRSFPGYSAWTIDSYIEGINELDLDYKYSIAMPPGATMEYMRMVWDLKPSLTKTEMPGDVILGLTRSRAPRNRWKKLAHYVYQNAGGRIYSWGEQFSSLLDMNTKKSRDYSVVYRIMVNG